MTQISNNIEIDELRHYILENFSNNQIDLALYSDSLDDKGKIDAELLKDPVFAAFWQLQSLLLKEIEEPTQINSAEASVSDSYLDDAYNRTQQDYQNYVQELASQDNDIRNYLIAEQQTQTQSQSWAASLNTAFSKAATTSSQSSQTVVAGSQSVSGYSMMASTTDTDNTTTAEVDAINYDYTQDARELGERLGLGGIYSDAVEFEQLVQETTAGIFTALSEMDQQLVQLKEALESGSISATEFEADMSTISASREALLAVLQHTTNALTTTMEMYSQLVKQAVDGAQSIANNFKY